MDLYLYSAFLVLMTTQSSLQYSFTFTQSHTHSYSASISSSFLFYEAQFRVPKDTSACRFGKNGDQTADLQIGGRPLYPLSHSLWIMNSERTWHVSINTQPFRKLFFFKLEKSGWMWLRLCFYTTKNKGIPGIQWTTSLQEKYEFLLKNTWYDKNVRNRC